MVGSSNTNMDPSCALPISLASFSLCASPPRQARRLLAEGQISQTEIFQYLQSLTHDFELSAGLKCSVYVHRHQLRHGISLIGIFIIKYVFSLLAVSGASASRTRYVHVRQELHVKAYYARSVAYRTAQFSRIVRKNLPPYILCPWRPLFWRTPFSARHAHWHR